MEVQDYLKYLEVIRPIEPNLDDLNVLIRTHSERVTFENLDCLLRREVSLNAKAVLTKVTLRGRGGYCLELNCLFGRLLQALGYRVQLRAARFCLMTPDDAPEKTRLIHVTLLVQLPDGGDPWITDVAQAFIGMERALPLKGGDTTPYRVREVDDSGAVEHSLPTKSGGWKAFFLIEPYGRRSEDDGCWLQLVRERFIRWSPSDGILEKRVLSSEDEILELLQTVFRLRLSPEEDTEPLRVRLRELLDSWREDGSFWEKKSRWPEC
ncbi:arylamine N-acetyltransferase-like [Amblyomma americanum]